MASAAPKVRPRAQSLAVAVRAISAAHTVTVFDSLGTDKVHFDDREEAENALRARLHRSESDQTGAV